jgi:hypothetical protein
MTEAGFVRWVPACAGMTEAGMARWVPACVGRTELASCAFASSIRRAFIELLRTIQPPELKSGVALGVQSSPTETHVDFIDDCYNSV